MRHVCFSDADHPVSRATDQLIAVLAAQADRRLAAVLRAVDAETAEGAMRALLDLAASWTPHATALQLGKAFELMALTGRGEVLERAFWYWDQVDATCGAKIRELVAAGQGGDNPGGEDDEAKDAAAAGYLPESPSQAGN